MRKKIKDQDCEIEVEMDLSNEEHPKVKASIKGKNCEKYTKDLGL